MSELKLVAPFNASANNHLRILDLLKQKPAPVSGPLPIFKVPVRLDTDVLAIIGENDRKMPENAGKKTHGISEDSKDANTSIEDATEDAVAEETPSSFIELGAFQPKNRLEQITTVFLQDFPALRPIHVAKVFGMVSLACGLEIPKEFRFSVMAESINDTRGVFVRYTSVEMARWAQKSFLKILPGITAVFDENLSTLEVLEGPESAETTSFDETAGKIAALFANKKLYSHGSGRSGTEDLDEVMQYYKTYKVENSELVEVPKELKEVIVRDIIKFRAKVLTLEREARKKEIEKERRKAKLRLTLIFEGIRSSATIKDKTSVPLLDLVMAEPLEQDVLETNPLDALSDAEYEAHIKAENSRKQQEQYEAEYTKMRLLEESEKATLLERLHSARDYEQTLIENKLSYMDEFKMALEYDSSRIGEFSSVVSNKFGLYYKNHGEYLRLRNLERTKEETNDETDRVDEEKSRSSQPNPAPVFVAKPGLEPKKHTEPATTTVVVVSAFSEANLAKIKEKIASLVEEFLGIREDLLIDFIYDFVLEHNLARGGDLVTELQETLDEDSQTVVDQLHDFIASL